MGASEEESTEASNTGTAGPQPSISGSVRPPITPLKDSLTQQTSEGSRLLQRELESNVMITQDRTVVLKRAIDFVSRISNSGDLSSATGLLQPSTTGGDAESHKFSPELLYMMTITPEHEPGIMKRSYWPDHISLETLEIMCLSIMEDKADRQTLVRYRISVYMKAVNMISRLPRRDRSVSVRRHLEQSKKQYEDEIYRALEELDFLAPPCLSFLQALLSGALFMQNQGDMSRSWTLTAFASRILVSLNYHTIKQSDSSDREMQDIYRALYVCYYLDKILSVLLLRPPSLPRLKVKPVDLVILETRLPLSACVKVMVSLGQIQEGVLDILFSRNGKDDQVSTVNALVSEMYQVRALMSEPRCQTLAQETHFEWLAIEFGYYALLASVFHLKQRVMQGPLARQECLHAARQSLVQLTKIQNEIAHRTLLFFPLSPFFIVFCNVIYAKNDEDYTLLSKVTNGIARFTSRSRSVAELHKLFSAFLGLCEPLFNERRRAPHPGAILSQSYTTDPTPTLPQPDVTAETGNPLAEAPPFPRYDIPVEPRLPQAGGVEQDQDALYDQPDEFGSIENDLMWELLQSQPWLGWMGSDA
ncbi:transcriptional regulator family: Fungal Specific TF [Aspergillus niger]|uniref:Xylanolytic transcriptional activator regulatory domain-containing protein n=1 Tax=Aspergillus niger TaxID=5061 RepID=A0A9W6ECI8_ASPNG|nr:transcriptional regulator family: Fungal Specific TF [Aspergillus niger]KAI2948454.1 transcriptional regulator family: Fungal Specific TF [Aspergillus niger]KAI2982598.1 transcriptional regulator family: Fungal Specific TF [Aspergillus niger]KAI3050518.1 transcriptional regulator family: Fungal Specific TF [Aspergillus niger]KAI3080344.1 transcriptional regulator family: Fungal Specific TF [Aspergillus niger]